MAIVVALAASSAAIALWQRRQPDRDFRELRARVRTWWVIVGLFVFAVLLNRGGAILFFACVSGLALREYLSLVSPRIADWRILLWAYLCVPLQYLWIYWEWYGVFIIFIPVYMFMLLPLRMVIAGETQGFIKAAGTLHWGLMVTVFSLSHAAFLLALPHDVSPQAGGDGLLLYLLLRGPGKWSVDAVLRDRMGDRQAGAAQITPSADTIRNRAP